MMTLMPYLAEGGSSSSSAPSAPASLLDLNEPDESQHRQVLVMACVGNHNKISGCCSSSCHSENSSTLAAALSKEAGPDASGCRRLRCIVYSLCAECVSLSDGARRLEVNTFFFFYFITGTPTRGRLIAQKIGDDDDDEDVVFPSSPKVFPTLRRRRRQES